jgi:hypothetical protein
MAARRQWRTSLWSVAFLPWLLPKEVYSLSNPLPARFREVEIVNKFEKEYIHSHALFLSVRVVYDVPRVHKIVPEKRAREITSKVSRGVIAGLSLGLSQKGTSVDKV